MIKVTETETGLTISESDPVGAAYKLGARVRGMRRSHKHLDSHSLAIEDDIIPVIEVDMIDKINQAFREGWFDTAERNGCI